MTHEQPTPAPVEVTALKPCPVCGNAPKWRGSQHDYIAGIYRLQCLGETHLFQSYGATEAICIAAWNTRHSAPAGDVEPVAWMYHHADLHEYEFIKTQAVRARCKQAGHFPCDAGWTETPLYTHPAPPADLVELVEAAWRAGFQTARDCLPDDADDVLTEDVEHDQWLDSDTRAAIAAMKGEMK